MFPRRDFAVVAEALQAAQAAGAGCVVTTRLVTVANAWWGVPAGRVVHITWVYLCRAPEWEAQLPEETRKRLSDPADEEFGRFPNYPIVSLRLTVPQARPRHPLSPMWDQLMRNWQITIEITIWK